VESGEYEAVMVAKAGLDRLGLSKRISEVLSPEVCMPAVGQGAIGVECRLKDTEAGDLLAPLDDAETRTAIIAERALLGALQGGCQVRLGAWARVERGELLLDSCVCSVDGSQYVKQRATAPPDQAAQLGEHMARLLVEEGAQSILEEVSRRRGLSNSKKFGGEANRHYAFRGAERGTGSGSVCEWRDSRGYYADLVRRPGRLRT